jgi:Virulence factor
MSMMMKFHARAPCGKPPHPAARPCRKWVVPARNHVEIRHWLSVIDPYKQREQKVGIASMVEVTVVYWRDIPAQVIVGKGRAASKVQLPERFEQAIDRCAMKIGARDTDSYLAEWRKAEPYTVEGEAAAVAASEAARLEAEFDTQRIKALIDADGWAKAHG